MVTFFVSFEMLTQLPVASRSGLHFSTCELMAIVISIVNEEDCRQKARGIFL
jgi:hypothetical protein